jgi:hypothetical protein
VSDTYVKEHRATTSTARDDGGIGIESAHLVGHVNVIPHWFGTCCVTGKTSQSQHHIKLCVVSVSAEFHEASAAVMMMGLGKCGGQVIAAVGTTIRQVVIRWVSKTSTKQLIPVIGRHGQFRFSGQNTEDEIGVLVIAAVQDGFHVGGHGVRAFMDRCTS